MSKISTFLNDYAAALSRAQAFDTKVNNDATKISTDYAAIVALSLRQALGAIEITISKNADGSYNTNDVIVFMKGTSLKYVMEQCGLNFCGIEISSDGVMIRTSVFLTSR